MFCSVDENYSRHCLHSAFTISVQFYIGFPTSECPRRSRLEMSNTPPTAAVSTPPVPRFCRRRLIRILLKRGSLGLGERSYSIKFQSTPPFYSTCNYIFFSSWYLRVSFKYFEFTTTFTTNKIRIL